MSYFLFHTVFLTSSVIATFLWTKNPSLSMFNLQAVGIIIISYFAGKMFSKSRQKASNLLDALIFTILIMFLVMTSGGINSDLFFLLYFLLFGLSLLFEPSQSFVLAMTLLAVFVIDVGFDLNQSGAINALSLVLISPLASIFAKKYIQNLESSGKIKVLSNIISDEETETLIWLSTKAKPTLVNLLDTTSQVIGSNLLPNRLQENLKKLHQDLIDLHQSATTLEDEVDKRSDG